MSDVQCGDTFVTARGVISLTRSLLMAVGRTTFYMRTRVFNFDVITQFLE